MDLKRSNKTIFFRYKPLCPATWPHWRGVPSEGVEKLVQHLGYQPDEYKMGRWVVSAFQLYNFFTEHLFLLKNPLCSIILKGQRYLYDMPGHFLPQKMPLKSANMSWVSNSELGRHFSQIFIFILSMCQLCFIATKLQAKYKGYKVKGEFRKQKEAGKQ